MLFQVGIQPSYKVGLAMLRHSVYQPIRVLQFFALMRVVNIGEINDSLEATGTEKEGRADGTVTEC